MRYLDWDVLLFPAGEQGSHIPLKEFKTACCAEQFENAVHPTPLLTTYVPSLAMGKPFQISVHSWSEIVPVLTMSSTKPKATKPLELLQVKVVIDGVCVSTKSFPIESTWPQAITSTTPPSADEVVDHLRFPPFHRNITSQRRYDPSDQVGRIRVELSSGYVNPKHNHFVKTCNLINFAFYAVPMEILEVKGIAWPNPRLLGNPPPGNDYFGTPAMLTNMAAPTKHKRAVTANANLMPAAGFGMQAFSYPLNPFAEDANSNYDASSRSTSAYSTLTDCAAPLFQKMPMVPAYPTNLAEYARKQQQFSLRLPSDQLQMILSAIHPPGQAEGMVNGTATMPPPPLPAYATASKGTNFPDTYQLPGLPSVRAPPAPDSSNIADRRDGSHYSDVSMHAGCTGFPTCTSEDEEGHIVHQMPTTPATVVKGRKEGSSPTKRKLSESAGMGDHAEKKRRRSSRLLQHDSGYSGFGSGDGSDERANADASEGDGAAVVESG